MKIMLNVPEMSKRTSHLLAYLRDESTILHKLHELAMLTTVRELDCQFIWYAHAPQAPFQPRSTLLGQTIDPDPNI